MALNLPSLPKKTMCKNPKIKETKKFKDQKTFQHLIAKTQHSMFEYPHKIAQILWHHQLRHITNEKENHGP